MLSDQCVNGWLSLARLLESFPGNKGGMAPQYLYTCPSVCVCVCVCALSGHKGLQFACFIPHPVFHFMVN